MFVSRCRTRQSGIFITLLKNFLFYISRLLLTMGNRIPGKQLYRPKNGAVWWEHLLFGSKTVPQQGGLVLVEQPRALQQRCTAGGWEEYQTDRKQATELLENEPLVSYQTATLSVHYNPATGWGLSPGRQRLGAEGREVDRMQIPSVWTDAKLQHFLTRWGRNDRSSRRDGSRKDQIQQKVKFHQLLWKLTSLSPPRGHHSDNVR